MRKLLLLVTLLLTVVGAWAVSTGEGDGTVLEVDREGHTLLIDHGDIGDMMGPMTMAFTVDDPGLLAGIEPGDKVRITVEWRGGEEFVITKMRVVSPPP